jgi:predicted nuclease with RNAse H fold
MGSSLPSVHIRQTRVTRHGLSCRHGLRERVVEQHPVSQRTVLLTSTKSDLRSMEAMEA